MSEGVEGAQLPHLHSEAAKAEGQPSGVGRLHGGEQAEVNPHTVSRFPEGFRIHDRSSVLSSSNFKIYQNHARITDIEVFSYPCKDRSCNLRAIQRQPEMHSKR